MTPPIVAVVVTGGPSGGKSSGIPYLAKQARSNGWLTFVIAEHALALIEAGLPPLPELHKNPAAWASFQREILRRQLAELEGFVELGASLGQPTLILGDRGPRDSVAYLGEQGFADICESVNIDPLSLSSRYAAVIHLVSAAVGAVEHYNTEGNLARHESVEEAVALDARTQAAWADHPQHVVIDNSTSFEQKMERAWQALAQRLPAL